MKEQRRCSTWRKIKNFTCRNSGSRLWICTISEEEIYKPNRTLIKKGKQYMKEKDELDNFEQLGRALLRKMNPCIDLVEKIAFDISHKYLLPMKNYVKEKHIPI